MSRTAQPNPRAPASAARSRGPAKPRSSPPPASPSHHRPKTAHADRTEPPSAPPRPRSLQRRSPQPPHSRGNRSHAASRPTHTPACAPPAPILPMRGGDRLDPLHPDRIVHMPKLVDIRVLRRDREREPAHPATPSCHNTNACSSALSRNDSNRPDLPPCPAPILVLSSSTLSSVFINRSLAAHFAGSQ
jgi:hypothetical protein